MESPSGKTVNAGWSPPVLVAELHAQSPDDEAAEGDDHHGPDGGVREEREVAQGDQGGDRDPRDAPPGLAEQDADRDREGDEADDQVDPSPRREGELVRVVQT